ncbi:MAG: sigma-70 family RNA polymerase sigma factor [Verrucomicrobiae bacterium]|nr:sigma-70 family RNA polymerase sigma factor [Verrucomicrobiae bacterium]
MNQAGQGGGLSRPGGDASPAFATTHWSVVLAARELGDAEQAHTALCRLCEDYWYPLYAYVRRRGHAHEDAADLTQAFFARFLDHGFIHDVTPGVGRFRSFLLSAIKHFLANEWDRARALKRGGGETPVSLDDEEARRRYALEPADPVTPETLYERRWALAVLEQVLARLRAEFDAREKGGLFDRLKVFLTADQPEGAYAATATAAGLSEGAVKVAVHRLRRRYGELLRAQIAGTVADPADVGAEVRHFIAMLGR